MTLLLLFTFYNRKENLGKILVFYADEILVMGTVVCKYKNLRVPYLILQFYSICEIRKKLIAGENEVFYSIHTYIHRYTLTLTD